jgi:stage V sporulation protein AB
MIRYIIAGVVAFGGGITVGSAAAAFIALLKIVPRLVQISNTNDQIKTYQYVLTAGFVLFTGVYFSNFHFNLSKYITIPIGFLYGVFIGMLSSALAEVLNVIPVLSKKFKLKNRMNYIIYTLLFGKVAGALYFWILMK